MNIEHLPQAFAALPLGEQITWGSVLFAVLLMTVFLLLCERQYFRSREKAGSWAILRALSFLLLLPLTITGVLVPARSVSGMEALAFFYGALFTVAPLIWLGGHALIGRLLRPRLSSGECFALAASGLLIISVPAIGLSLIKEPIFQASRGLWEAGVDSADHRPFPLRAEPLRMFEIPGAGKVLTQSLLAPPGLHIERIDRQAGEGGYFDTRGVAHPVFCRDGENIHLLWSAREEAPRLRVYWTAELGRRVHANWTPGSMQSLASETFLVGFRDDGLNLPVPIARSRAALSILSPGGHTYRNMLDRLQPGETSENDCLMPVYRRQDWQKEGQIQMLTLMFQFPDGRPPMIAEIRRPDSAPTQ